jgi:hypothetical protein
MCDVPAHPVCLVYLVFWLNETNQMNQINKTNQFEHPAKSRRHFVGALE